MIRLSGISSGYHGITVIKNINITLEPGTLTSLIGRNGCGKSTLLKTASGLLSPYQGEVFLGEQPLISLHGKEVARKLSYLPQIKEIPDMKVYDLVMHGRFPYLGLFGNPKPADKEAVEQALESMGLLTLRHQNLRELSGGQQQKAYLAMVLAQNTEVICFDEPTAFLDINYQLEILECLIKLKNQGKTILMVLHDINQALIYSDRICILDQGNIQAFGCPENILTENVIDRVFHISGEAVTNKEGRKHYLFSLSKNGDVSK